MSHLTLFIDQKNKLDINCKMFGRESVFYNGVLVSSKKSLFGTAHIFEVREADEQVQYHVHLNGKWRLRMHIEVFRNGRALLLY
jgi:hypothetical protein